MRRRLLLVIAVVVALALSLVIATASMSRGDKVGAPVGVPAGPPLVLSPSERGLLGKFARGEMAFSGKAFLLGSHGSKALYQLERNNGGACYSLGRVTSAFRFGRFGTIACSEYFPYRDALLDFSTVEIAKGGNEEPRFVNVQGVASDRVKVIRALSEDGTVLGEAQVTNGAYWVDLPQGQTAAKVFALDAQGASVGSEPR